jgi:hypothetical protein
VIKKVRGRQLARVSAVAYRESLWSEVYPGNYHTVQCFQPAVLAAETALDLAPQQRKRVVWRMDGGAGSDEQLRWLLGRDYHVLCKGLSNRRADALARQVSRWDEYRPAVWVGEVPGASLDLGRPVRLFVKRQLRAGEFSHSYFVSTLSLPAKRAYLALYDDRGQAEVEQFRGDKAGLGLQARRKRSYAGQMGYILLTDLAHNLLADFYWRALVGSRFAGYGPKRIVRDLLAMPGRLWMEDSQLVRVELLSQKQFSQDLLQCLVRYCADE